VSRCPIMRRVFPLLAAAMVHAGCSRSAWEPDTRWHQETLSETNASWRGSYQNALDTLRLRSHAWKLIGYDGKRDRCEWGFKVVVEFPGRPSNMMTNAHGDPLFMPINNLDYDLFDKDGFRLTSLSLRPGPVPKLPEGYFLEDFGVAERETKTFQHTGFIPSATARRAAYGKLSIQAGYAYPKTFIPDTPKSGKTD
jgi:hypothetical protein